MSTTKMRNNRWEGNRCYFGDLEFWPERGLIHILDTVTGQYEIISVDTALERLQAIVAGAGPQKFPDERKRMLDFADQMFKCCKIANAQGDPLDRRELMKLLKNYPLQPVQLPQIVNKKKCQVLFPGKTTVNPPVCH